MSNSGTFVAEDGSVYIDKKRHMWFVSLVLPALGIFGPIAYMQTGNEFFLWLLFIVAYGIIPFVDYFMGEDSSNPPESVVKQLEADNYYRYIVLAHVPVVIGAFVFFTWFVGTQELSLTGYLAVALTAGNIGGHGLNIGHELGHKRKKLDQWMSKIVLAPAAYGHFFIEHNKGHHAHVATPEDPASSKMGETIYQFALRELPGAIRRAYNVEKERLNKEGKSHWSLENEYLHSLLMTLTFYATMAVMFGIGVVPFLLIAAFWSMWQLTSANYIEHYGLLRQKNENGRYESPKPHHSWNSNHVFSNWALFHLQRHSDHHANATRGYQSLRHFEGLPTLPNGYFGMYVIAYIPWLWFKVMDKRLLEITDGDLDKINILPEKKDALIRKYHLQAVPA